MRQTRSPQRLSDEVIAALGTMPDRALAKKTGRAESTIRTARMARGIAQATTKSTLDDEAIGALGTMSDIDLATKIGRSESTIRSARTRRGIAKYVEVLFDDAALAALGTMTDIDLSKTTGISVGNVRKERAKRGIKKFSRSVNTPKASVTIGARKCLDEKTQAALGTMTDADLSRTSGIPATLIRKERINQGIPRFSRAVKTPKKSRKPKICQSIDDKTVSALGAMSDAELSRVSGVPVTRISKERIKRGIATFVAPLPVIDDDMRHLLHWAANETAALRLSLPVSVIEKLRATYGIAGLRLSKEPPVGLLELIGKAEDTSLALKFGVRVKWIRKIRAKLGLEPYNPRKIGRNRIPSAALNKLGKISDRALAREFGSFAKVYRDLRAELGIESFQPKVRCDYKAELDENLQALLRWAPNSEVHRRTGLTPYKIKKYRAVHGIPGLNLRQQPPPGLIDAIQAGTMSDVQMDKHFGTPSKKIKAIRRKLAASTSPEQSPEQTG